MWGHTFDQAEQVFNEAKRDCPDDPWGLYDTIFAEVGLARAHKARYKGSRGSNPLRHLLHVRARQSQSRRRH